MSSPIRPPSVPPAPVAARAVPAVFLGVVGMTMFAATLPATRLALVGFNPVFITAGRAVLAALIAASFLAAARVAPPRGADIRHLAAIALCLVVGFPLFTGLAMVHVGAGHGGVVLAIMPIATALAARIVGDERPGTAFWLLGAAGAAIVLVFVLSDSGWRLGPGDLFLVAAALSAGFGYALSGRLARTMPGWAVIGWALVMSLPATVPATALSAPAAWPHSVAAWAGFVYLGAVSMFLGFVFWNAAMARGGISKIAQIQLLQPFVTIAIAALVAAEPVEGRQIAFAAAVVVVVAAAQRLRVARIAAPSPPQGR